MASNSSVQEITSRLSASLAQVREGNLGPVGSMIDMIDSIADDARPENLVQFRDGLANLLMVEGDAFQQEFAALTGTLRVAPEAGSEPAASVEETSLYLRLGGEGAIKSVVDVFYRKVLDDPALQPIFGDADVAQLKRHQVHFLSQVTGGPKGYQGRQLAEAHRGLGITEDHFNRVAQHLLATLREHSVPGAEIEQVIAIVESVRDEIVARDGAQGNGSAAEAGAPAASAQHGNGSAAAAPATPAKPGNGVGAPGNGSTRAKAPSSPPPFQEPMEEIDKELYSEFVDDAVSHLESIEKNFLNLETDPGNMRIIDDIFRPFHTIKGVSGYLALTQISRVCHETENLLDLGRKGQVEITGDVVDLVLEVVDFLKKLLSVVAESDAPQRSLSHFQDEAEQCVQRISEVRALQVPGSAPAVAPARTEPHGPPLGEILLEQHVIQPQDLERAIEVQRSEGGPLGEVIIREHLAKPLQVAQALRQQQASEHPVAKAAEAAEDAPLITQTSENIRVRVNLLDRLMTLAGELVLGRNQLLQKLSGVSDEMTGLNSLLHNVDRVTSELQEAVMQTRMQPLSGLFSRFHRVIRDLARSLGKKIELTVEGEKVELDKTLIEALTDPLTHLIRNSADHGIEQPEQRRAAHKPETGRVSLVAYHEGGRVYVRIQDDGAGVDVERVKEKAVEKGLITREKATQMSDREALRLLFMPGLSTAQQVTGVSGRGVGMDVVLRNIQNVGGTVDITSEPGKGSTFLLGLPLTLAIIPALIVSTARQRFAIPQSNLVELVYLEGEDARNAILNVRGSEVYSLRGEMLPLVRLERVLNLSDEQQAPTGKQDGSLSIVVMAAGANQFGLAVERVFDTEEIVVQPLSNLLKDVGVFAGATLMGDGAAALILDIAGLMKAAEISMDGQAGGDAHAARDVGDDAEHQDDQTILLFNVNRNEQMAVPLTIISRLETVRMSDVRTSIHGKVISYRDAMLPLIFPEEHTDIAQPPDGRETIKVLVFEIEKPVGLVVSEIIDSVQVSVSMDDSALTPRGFSGLALVNGQPTAFLDIYQLIEVAYPKWFDQKRSKRTEVRENVRLLLAEDSTFYRNMEKAYLTQEGFHVLEAANGQEAWEILRREPVDLVVTDIEMPELNGFELAERIRGDKDLRHLPIVAVTSLTQDEERQRGMKAGIDSYLIKLQREVLLEEVHRLLSERRQMN